MGSTFSSYQIAKSGLYTAQRGLFVTGHNISNVNTSGYVRQQVMFVESTPAKYGKIQIGLGADIQETRQIRNSFLDNMYRSENELLGYWEARSKTIQELESILGEPVGQRLQEVIDEFFDGWQELSKDPSSLTVRALLRQRATVLVNTINHIGTQLDKLQMDLNEEIKLKVNEINNIAAKIAKLNVSIVANEGTGDNANDLRDQRNLLLDELSKLINIDIYEQSNGSVSVMVGGVFLVHGGEAEKMIAGNNGEKTLFVTPLWEKDNSKVALSGGTLKGLIEARGDVAAYGGSIENGSVIESGYTMKDIENDANSDLYRFDPQSTNIIPELKRGLNILVNLLARTVNAIHREGVALDGSIGHNFFTKINQDLPFEMNNIQVNPDFIDLDLIAASITGESGDNTIAQRIVELRNREFMKSKNLTLNVYDFYQSIITWVGTSGQEAERVTQNQNILLTQIQNSRDATSAVAMDEELANMIKYQHSYNASARIINVIDEMIETVINKL